MILASNKVKDVTLYCESYVIYFEVKVGEYWKRGSKKVLCNKERYAKGS